MNIALEIKKRIGEIMKVEAAKFDQEIRIDEAYEQIERIKASIAKSDERVEKLKKEIEELKSRQGSQE